MKIRIYISFVLTALLAAGCNEAPFEEIEGEEDPVEVVEPQEVSFRTKLSVPTATKGPVMTLDLLQEADAGFGVNAVYTNGNWSDADSRFPGFMYDQRVLWNGEKWEYDPVQFWPTLEEEKVSFFAWAPYGDPGITICDTTSADADPSILHFTMADKSEETIDFIASSAIDNSESNPNSMVTFVFRHELTRVEMYAKVDEDLYREDDDANKTRVIIRSAKFTGLNFYTEGDYLYNTEVLDGPGSWSFDGISVTESYPITICGEDVFIDTKEPYVAENAIVLSNKNIEYQLLVPSNAEPEERYIYLIPPAGVGGALTGDIAVEFLYDIVTEDDQLMKGYTCTSSTKVVNLPMGTLKQGYSYKFSFTFCLNQIKLDASVVYGDDDTNTDVDF